MYKQSFMLDQAVLYETCYFFNMHIINNYDHFRDLTKMIKFNN